MSSYAWKFQHNTDHGEVFVTTLQFEANRSYLLILAGNNDDETQNPNCTLRRYSGDELVIFNQVSLPYGSSYAFRVPSTGLYKLNLTNLPNLNWAFIQLYAWVV